MDQQALAEVESFLNAAGWNYTVFLRAYSAPVTNLPAAEQIGAALGTRVAVTDVEQISTQDMLAEVRSCLTYAGDHGAGPDPAAMQSERFAELLEQTVREIEDMAKAATRIDAFRVTDGHPAYPVFWEFAFLFTMPAKAVVLMGSSSD